jgi:hypothetical protein
MGAPAPGIAHAAFSAVFRTWMLGEDVAGPVGETQL